MVPPRHFRIFLSSPGDVSEERALAREIIKNDLPYDPFLRGRASLEVVSWDDPSSPTPMLATLNATGSDRSWVPKTIRVRFRRRYTLGDAWGLRFRTLSGGPLASGIYQEPNGNMKMPFQQNHNQKFSFIAALKRSFLMPTIRT